MGIEEAFSWKKFISGLFAPLNFAKSFVSMVQICIIALTIAAIVFAGYAVWKKTHKKAPVLLPIEVTTNSGIVHSSTDDNRLKKCYFLSVCF